MKNTKETLPDNSALAEIADAFLDRDWCRFAKLVADAPEIDLPGKASFAMREIAISAIERLKQDGQRNHLECVTDYAVTAERDLR